MVKRLIVACDGTWVSSDNGYVEDKNAPGGIRLANPSNVTRICRALEPKSSDGKISQIVYYQGGLGTQDNWWSKYAGGYLGAGIGENIREAYAFLCNNYEEGDEIFLIGFSRGAFTARSIAGLIGSIGLLGKEGMRAFYPIFCDWENQNKEGYKSLIESSVWPVKGRPKFSDRAYLDRLVKNKLTRPDITIKAIAVWDTVGSLGVPELKLLGYPWNPNEHRQLSFINTEVGPNVEYAYQALALDEVRKPFSPTVWEAPAEGTPHKLKQLRQCWFPGVHTTIGGGHDDTNISDITIAWLISKLSPLLSFRSDYVLGLQKANVEYYKQNIHVDKDRPSYGTGLIKRSDDGYDTYLTGRQIRTPGQYQALDSDTGKPIRRLRGTNESIHPSFRYRIDSKGPGEVSSDLDYTGSRKYEPQALKKWKCLKANEKIHVKSTDEWGEAALDNDGVRWYFKTADGLEIVLPEENIEKDSQEWKLLHAWDSDGVAKALDLD